jgi:hypothetical protein
MKLFDSLTSEQFNRIIEERINSILEISNELVQEFIPIESLRPYYIEYPPIFSNKTHLKRCLLGSGADKLGALQRFYLMTYIVDGSIMFRAKNEINSEMWINFDNNFNWGQLNNENPKLSIKGYSGLRGANLIKIVSLNELHFPLDPSLTIKIEVDGLLVLNRSIATLISCLQPNNQVAVLNLQFSDFDELTIEIININPDLNFDCSIVFQ